MLHLRKRSGWYHSVGRVGGVLIRRSLHTQSLGEAERRLQALQRFYIGGQEQAAVKWQTFAKELESQWASGLLKPLTVRKYGFVLDRFSRFLSDRGIIFVDQVTPAIIEDYSAARSKDRHPTLDKRVGPEGIKADLRVLRRFCSIAVDRGYLERNQVKGKLNSRAAQTQPFSREEVEAMLAACQSRNHRGGAIDLSPVILLFCNTGLRISDVIHFPKTAIRGDWITLTTRKRGKPVQIPLHNATSEALEAYRKRQNAAQRQSPYLFSTDSGKPILGLDSYLRRLWARAGIERAHAHRFRDTFAVRLLEQGASLYDVARLLGITVVVAERHYSPYVRELRERGQKLVAEMDFGRPRPAILQKKRARFVHVLERRESKAC